jgi:hypothetical protein
MFVPDHGTANTSAWNTYDILQLSLHIITLETIPCTVGHQKGRRSIAPVNANAMGVIQKFITFATTTEISLQFA